jgi:hypothetical protein
VEPAVDASGVALVSSRLERAVLDAGLAVRACPFGQALQRNHPGHRHSQDQTPFGLSTIELNHGPAIHRTFWALEAHPHLGMPIDLDAERPYILWVTRAMQAAARIAGMCWGAVPVEHRIAVLDLDDLGALHSHYIPGSRGDEGGAALHFEGLERPSPRMSLQAMAEAAQATPCFAAAHAAHLQLAGPEGLQALHARREALNARLEQATQQPMTLPEVTEAMKGVLSEQDTELPEAVRRVEVAFRAYNELVNHMLWALLGIAEHRTDPVILREDLGTVRVSSDARRQSAHVTLRDFGMGEIPGLSGPFIIAGGIPVDGMYLSTTNVIQWAGETFIDIVGDRLAALEDIVEESL